MSFLTHCTSILRRHIITSSTATSLSTATGTVLVAAIALHSLSSSSSGPAVRNHTCNASAFVSGPYTAAVNNTNTTPKPSPARNTSSAATVTASSPSSSSSSSSSSSASSCAVSPTVSSCSPSASSPYGCFSYYYLHGFASSPQSIKAQQLKQFFEKQNVQLIAPDWNLPSFQKLLTASAIQFLQQTINKPKAEDPNASSQSSVSAGNRLIGSSMGGYLSCFLSSSTHSPSTASSIDSIILIAPAFELVHRWASMIGPSKFRAWEQSGFMDFFNYKTNRNEPLHFAFHEKMKQLPPMPLPDAHINVYIFHGINDDVVPVELSRKFVQKLKEEREKLRKAAAASGDNKNKIGEVALFELDDDHRMTKEATILRLETLIQQKWKQKNIAQ